MQVSEEPHPPTEHLLRQEMKPRATRQRLAQLPRGGDVIEAAGRERLLRGGGGKAVVAHLLQKRLG